MERLGDRYGGDLGTDLLGAADRRDLGQFSRQSGWVGGLDRRRRPDLLSLAQSTLLSR